MLPDIRFADWTLRDTVRHIHGRVTSGRSHYICFCEANLYTQTVRNPDLAEILSRADAVLADGVSVLLLSRLTGRPVPKRVPGPTVLPAVVDHGQEHGYRHFFYGAGHGVARKMVANLRARYPRMQVAGVHTPPYCDMPDLDSDGFREKFAASKADVLWVGLGAPKQEFWMARYAQELNVPVMLGVGAAFDFLSGHRRWAPMWVRKAGMEWAFRAVTGGPRVFVRNARCVSRMAAILAASAATRLVGSAQRCRQSAPQQS